MGRSDTWRQSDSGRSGWMMFDRGRVRHWPAGAEALRYLVLGLSLVALPETAVSGVREAARAREEANRVQAQDREVPPSRPLPAKVCASFAISSVNRGATGYALPHAGP